MVRPWGSLPHGGPVEAPSPQTRPHGSCLAVSPSGCELFMRTSWSGGVQPISGKYRSAHRWLERSAASGSTVVNVRSAQTHIFIFAGLAARRLTSWSCTGRHALNNYRCHAVSEELACHDACGMLKNGICPKTRCFKVDQETQRLRNWSDMRHSDQTAWPHRVVVRSAVRH